MWFLYILGFFILICIYYGFKFGLFSRVRPTEKQVGPFKIVYRLFRGSYEEVHYGFIQIFNECRKNIKYTHTIGVYYDYPTPEKDMSKARAILGVVLDKYETNQNIEAFLKGNPAYKCVELPRITALHCYFPYISQISNIMLSIKVYPVLWETYQKLTSKHSQFYGKVEIFQIDTEKKSQAELFIPTTEEGKAYFLTPHAEPGMKDTGKKTM